MGVRHEKAPRALWQGELPLDGAFWTWTITVGLLVNLATSAAFLILVSIDRPWGALALGYASSVPYDVLAVVGVWRSAARHPGQTAQADLARLASAAVMLLLTLT